jgi:hypothetical protein
VQFQALGIVQEETRISKEDVDEKMFYRVGNTPILNGMHVQRKHMLTSVIVSNDIQLEGVGKM